MMIDLISQKIEAEKETKTYRRLDSEHPFSLYLGYNNKGFKSLVITEESEDVTITPTRIIETCICRRPDGKLSLEFALTDNRFANMFYRFCEDVIVSSKKTPKAQAIKFIVNRWGAWRLMFQNAENGYMSDSSIIGLLGELVFIEKKMQKIYGIDRSIHSWEGPIGNHKDFIIDDTWYEVKTVSNGSKSIKISSLEQLDSARIGKLEVVKVDQTSVENVNAINLNLQVEKVKKYIYNMDTLNEYNIKLAEVGYCYDEYYSRQSFELVRIKEFTVDEGFPRIRREDVRKEIIKVQYEILLPEL